jgi:HTH-type transcriptional regulator / antitoxin HigA
MLERKVAEAFPPGEFIKEEIEAREWSQQDLADILGRTPAAVSLLLTGKRPITPDLAKDLGAAFTLDPQYWMNLETSYRLFLAQHADTAVARRARLYTCAPVKEMIKRNWIEPSDSIDILEKRVCEFLGISSPEERPLVSYAARKSTSYAEESPSLTAWLRRAMRVARAVDVTGKFSTKAAEDALAKLRKLVSHAEEVRHVPKILAEAGIRFLIVEHLPQTRVDGATLWLDRKSPVIVVSLRYDRIDWFWFTLLHEMKHVLEGDGLDGDPPVDVALVGEDAVPTEDKPEREKRADGYAANFLIPSTEINKFIARIRPLYSKVRIQGFAMRLGVHPAIVVGQLQKRREILYSHSRDLLVKVRHIITTSALTDGWGQSLPPNL